MSEGVEKSVEAKKIREGAEEEKEKMNLEVMMRWMLEMKEGIDAVIRIQGELKEDLRGEMKNIMVKLEKQDVVIGEMGEKVEKLERENEKKEMEVAKLTGMLERMEKVLGGRGGEDREGREEVGGGKEGERDWERLVEEKVMEREKEARRRSQIRITGLEEKEGERMGTLRKEVVDILEKKMRVEGSGAMVMDVFRVGKKGEDRWNRPRVVIVKMGSEFQRNLVLRGKPNLREWKYLGVDMDRTKEEVEAWREELRRKREGKMKEVIQEVKEVEGGKSVEEGQRGTGRESEERAEENQGGGGVEGSKGRRRSGRLMEKGKGKVINGVEMFEDGSEGEEEEEDEDESHYHDEEWTEVRKGGRKGRARGRGKGRGGGGNSSR